MTMNVETLGTKASRPLGTPTLMRGAVPLIGHTWQLARDPLAFFDAVREQGDMVRIKVGPKDVFVVNTPELVRVMLVTNAHAFSVDGPLWESLRGLLGNGVATSNGEEHTRQRRLVQPAFRRERIAEYAGIMEEEARAAIGAWRPGQRFEIRREMIGFAMRIVSRSLFDTASISDKTRRIERSLQVLFADMYTRMIVPIPVLHRLPTPANLRFDRALADFHRLVDEIIAERRAHTEMRRVDLLHLLLETRDEVTGEPISDAEIHDQLVAMVVAGVETVASSLCWTFHLLAQHPEEEARLHTEVEAVLAGKRVTFEDLKRMPHLLNVITESLRLRPAVWVLTRRALVDTHLGHYRVDAGSDLLYCPYALQRDPRSFPRPLAFEPDRWQPERAKQVPAFAMIPFSAGGRKCPGDHFSMTEAAVVLATIASRFRLVPTPKLDASVKVGITLHPRWLEMEVQARPG